MNKFGSELWAEICKESDFKPKCTQLMSLNMEAKAVADASVIEASEHWSECLSVGKVFMKKHRDWAKGRSKTEKITTLSPSISQFVDFLVEVGVKVSVSLRLLNLKVLFFVAMGEDNNIAAAWSLVSNGGVYELFGSASSRGGAIVAPAPWMRSLLHPALVQYIQTWSEDDMDLEKWIADIKSIEDSIEANSQALESMAIVLKDLKALLGLLRGAVIPPQTTARNLTIVFDWLDTKDLDMVKTALKESTAGAIVVSTACDLKSKGAQDDVADRRFHTARDFLKDTRAYVAELKTSENNEGVLELAGWEVLQSLPIASVCGESFSNVLECSVLWSSMRLEEQSEDIGNWAEELVRQVVIADASLCAHTAFVIDGLKVLTVLENMGQGDGTTARQEARDDIVLAAQTALELFVDEKELVDVCVQSEPTKLAGLNQVLKESLLSAWGGDRQRILCNMQTRCLLKEVIDKVGELAKHDFPSSPEAAMQDFFAWATKGTEGSFLHAALACRSRLRRLQQQGKFENQVLSVTGKALRSNRDAGADEHEHQELGYSDVLESPSRFGSNLWLANKAQGVLDEAWSLSLKQLLDSVCLDSLELGAEDGQASTAQEAVSALLQAGAFERFMGDIGKAVAQEPVDCKCLVWNQLYDLSASICNVMYGEVDDLQVQLPVGMAANPDKASITIGKALLYEALGLYANVVTIGSFLAFVSKYHIGSQKMCMSENKLKQVLVRAIVFIEKMGLQAKSRLQSLQDCGELSVLTPNPAQVGEWLDRLPFSLNVLKRSVFAFVVDALNSFSQKVVNSIPPYDHLINNEKYIKSQVKKTLLDWSGRVLLSERSVELHKLVASASAAYASLGLGDKMEDDCEWKDVIGTISGCLAAAKKAIYVIAYATVVQLEAGSKQVASARALAAKDHDIPKALMDEVLRISGVAKQASKRSASASGPHMTT